MLDGSAGARARAAAIVPCLRSQVSVLETSAAARGGPGAGDGVSRSRDAGHATGEVVAWAGEHGFDLIHVDGGDELLLRLAGRGFRVSTVHRHGRRSDARRLVDELAHGLLAPYPSRLAPRRVPRPVRERVAFTGWLPATRLAGSLAGAAVRDRPRTVLVLAGHRGLGPAVEELGAAAAATPDWRWVVAGAPTGSLDGIGGVEDLGPVPDVSPWLASADAAVAGASLSGVATVVAAGVPLLAVPRADRAGVEEEFVALLGAVGTAVPLHRWPGAERWPQLLAGAADLSVGTRGPADAASAPYRAAATLDGWAEDETSDAVAAALRDRLETWLAAADRADADTADADLTDPDVADVDLTDPDVADVDLAEAGTGGGDVSAHGPASGR
ncbi:hypothetical protein [Egicoccus halophilus]|uniref:hypothetical protein n=1 Tax=Egicoccus halophilus TaxID=1670830 RepID=UPI00102FA23B|nr:hypothetical protein [Egicoccus halophilus]